MTEVLPKFRGLGGTARVVERLVLIGVTVAGAFCSWRMVSAVGACPTVSGVFCLVLSCARRLPKVSRITPVKQIITLFMG